MATGVVLANAVMASGASTSIPIPALDFEFGASISPKVVPKRDYVPVAVRVFGKVATSDGTHPSALRELVLDVDKDVRVDVEGYPTCQGSRLARCPDGRFEVSVSEAVFRNEAETRGVAAKTILKGKVLATCTPG